MDEDQLEIEEEVTTEDELDTDAEDISEDVEEEEAVDEQTEGEDTDAPEEEEPGEEEFSFSFDDEPEPEETPVIRTLRQKNREMAKRLKELEAKTAEVVPELGDEPTLEDCDYDADKFKTALFEWRERKDAIEQRQKAEKEKQNQLEEQYQAKLNSYSEAKKALGVKDFEDAEEAVRDGLSTVQQSIIIANATQPERLIYALGKSGKTMAELAKIEDPIAFTYQLAKLESKMSTTGKAKPKPERKVAGPFTPASKNKTLERAREKAAQTGDFSEVYRIKREMRAAK